MSSWLPATLTENSRISRPGQYTAALMNIIGSCTASPLIPSPILLQSWSTGRITRGQESVQVTDRIKCAYQSSGVPESRVYKKRADILQCIDQRLAGDDTREFAFIHDRD